MGGSAGNVTLQRGLGWGDDRYWAIRDRLVDAGRLELGRGRGGSVRLVQQATGNAGAAAVVSNMGAQDVPVLESALYEPVRGVLDKEWAREMRFRSHIVEVTAKQGRRDTGGTWTRPDIVVAALRVFPHVPGKYFDLITFEIKQLDGIDVTGVYEALAHRRAATQAYTWLHVPDGHEQDSDLTRLIDRVGDEAKRHGVGLIIGSNPEDFSSWDIKSRAMRFEPDPEFLNEFIAQQLSDLARDELAKWFR